MVALWGNEEGDECVLLTPSPTPIFREPPPPPPPRGLMEETSFFKETTGTCSQCVTSCPGPATLGRGDPFQIFTLLLFRHRLIPRPGGRSWPSEGQTATAAGETVSFCQQAFSTRWGLHSPSESSQAQRGVGNAWRGK